MLMRQSQPSCRCTSSSMSCAALLAPRAWLLHTCMGFLTVGHWQGCRQLACSVDLGVADAWPPDMRTTCGSACSVWCLQGVNIMQFCKEYNAQTQDKMGQIIPVEITVFEVRMHCKMAASSYVCSG